METFVVFQTGIEGAAVGLLIPPRYQKVLGPDWNDCRDRGTVNVLDNTYLGNNTHCRNAIVCGDMLLRVDTGTSIRLYDPLLFGATA
jgi:hypothetical protein